MQKTENFRQNLSMPVGGKISKISNRNSNLVHDQSLFSILHAVFHVRLPFFGLYIYNLVNVHTRAPGSDPSIYGNNGMDTLIEQSAQVRFVAN